jgi:hypothetical protein
MVNRSTEHKEGNYNAFRKLILEDIMCLTRMVGRKMEASQNI